MILIHNFELDDFVLSHKLSLQCFYTTSTSQDNFQTMPEKKYTNDINII